MADGRLSCLDACEAPGWSDLELEFKLSEAALADPNYDHHDEWFDAEHEIHLQPLLPGPAAPLLSPGSLADTLSDGALAAARTTTGGAASTSYGPVPAQQQSAVARRAAFGRTPQNAASPGPLAHLRSPLGRVASPALSRAFYRVGSPAVPASPLTPHRTPMRGTALFTTRESHGEGQSEAESSAGTGAPAFSAVGRSGGPLTAGRSGPLRSAEAGGGHSTGRSTPAGERPRAMRKSIGGALRVRQLAAAADGDEAGEEESPGGGAPPLLGDPATPGAGPAQRLSSALLRARNSSGVGRVSGQPMRLSAGSARGAAAGDDASPTSAESSPRRVSPAAAAFAPAAAAGAAGGSAEGGPALRLSGAGGDHPGLQAGRRSSGRRSSEGGHLRGARRVIATEPDENGAAAQSQTESHGGHVDTPPHAPALGEVTNLPSVSPAKKEARRSSARPPVPEPVAESPEEEAAPLEAEEDTENEQPPVAAAVKAAQGKAAVKQPAKAQPGGRQQSAPVSRPGWTSSARPAGSRSTASAAAAAARPASAKAPAAAASSTNKSASAAAPSAAPIGGKADAKKSTGPGARTEAAPAKARDGGPAAAATAAPEAPRPAPARPATKPAVVSQTLKFRKPEPAELAAAAERSRGAVPSTRAGAAAGRSHGGDAQKSGAAPADTAAEPRPAVSGAAAGRPAQAAPSRPGGAAAASMSELKYVDPALAEILAQHNRKVKPAEFAPRLHCLKDIKDWERRAGRKYYDLSASERIAANEEMTRYKRENAAAV